MPTRPLLALLLASAACAPRAITVDNITRIETQRRYVLTDGAATLENRPVVVEGERLSEVLRGARCMEGQSEWTSGIPAMLTFKVGSPLRADGFTADGKRLKLTGAQWCQLSDEGWKALWTAPE